MKITTKSRHRQWIGVSHFPKGRNDPENQVFGRRTTLCWKNYIMLFLTPSKSRVWQKTLYTLIRYQDTMGRRWYNDSLIEIFLEMFFLREQLISATKHFFSIYFYVLQALLNLTMTRLHHLLVLGKIKTAKKKKKVDAKQ